MQVICKGHNTCQYRKTCTHAVPHEIMSDGINSSYNCTLHCVDKSIYPHSYTPSDCFCDEKYLRKKKLKKLENVSISIR